MPLRDRLKRARKARELTQKQLGKLVGCGQSLVGNLESGKQASSSWIPKIADALRVPATWLIDDDYAGANPLEHAADVLSFPVQPTHADPHIAAVVELMGSTDARGRMECFAAVRAALDRYKAAQTPKVSGGA